MTAPARLRVGIVGLGAGRNHLAAYRQLPEAFEVRAVCDLDAARAREVAEAQAVARAETDLDVLLRDDELDLIDICTPSHLHARQTLEVLSAGKHAICEKPAAGSLAEVDAVSAAEARSGRRVMPIFQYRFGAGLQKLKRLVELGVTGPASLATSETAWRRRAAYYAVPWRGRWQTELGGILVTLAIHSHDAINYVLGPARRVLAVTATHNNPIETEDVFAAAVTLADGSLAALSGTTGSAHEISRLRFCYRRLTAESNLRPYTHTGDDWTFTPDEPEVAEQISEALAGFMPQPEGLVGQFQRFAEALPSGGPLPVTLSDARASLELITAIYASARTGQAQELPLRTDHPLYGGWQPPE
jgi:predicted dehydrogenase